MKLEFNLTQNGTYVAEVNVTGDFNLHLETKGGIVNMLQRGSEEGSFAPVTSWSKANVIDRDFGGLVYPKTIKIVSSSEVVNGYVNFNEGSGSGSGIGSSEKEDCIAVLSLGKGFVDEQGTITKLVKINLNSKKILFNDMPYDVILKKIDYDYKGADNVYVLTIGNLLTSDLDEISYTSFGSLNNYSAIEDAGLIKGEAEATPSGRTNSFSGITIVWEKADFDYFVWYFYDDSIGIAEKNILFILTDPTNIPD